MKISDRRPEAGKSIQIGQTSFPPRIGNGEHAKGYREEREREYGCTVD